MNIRDYKFEPKMSPEHERLINKITKAHNSAKNHLADKMDSEDHDSLIDKVDRLYKRIKHSTSETASEYHEKLIKKIRKAHDSVRTYLADKMDSEDHESPIRGAKDYRKFLDSPAHRISQEYDDSLIKKIGTAYKSAKHAVSDYIDKMYETTNENLKYKNVLKENTEIDTYDYLGDLNSIMESLDLSSIKETGKEVHNTMVNNPHKTAVVASAIANSAGIHKDKKEEPKLKTKLSKQDESEDENIKELKKVGRSVLYKGIPLTYGIGMVHLGLTAPAVGTALAAGTGATALGLGAYSLYKRHKFNKLSKDTRESAHAAALESLNKTHKHLMAKANSHIKKDVDHLVRSNKDEFLKNKENAHRMIMNHFSSDEYKKDLIKRVNSNNEGNK